MIDKTSRAENKRDTKIDGKQIRKQIQSRTTVMDTSSTVRDAKSIVHGTRGTINDSRGRIMTVHTHESLNHRVKRTFKDM